RGFRVAAASVPASLIICLKELGVCNGTNTPVVYEKRGLAHLLPVSLVGSSNIQVRLQYIDGNYAVLPEVIEASHGPHMQVLHVNNSVKLDISTCVCNAIKLDFYYQSLLGSPPYNQGFGQTLVTQNVSAKPNADR
ncbi:hypothetical protein M8C21_028400, partial [Ambrosia artemisiifolia]